MFYAVILGGGSGTRFWPKSRAVMPKHVMDIFGGTTLIRQTVERVLPVVSAEKILIVSNPQQIPQMQKLLPDAYYIEFYLGRNLFALDRQDEALIHFNKALEMNPSEEDVPYIYSYIGNCLKDIEQYREAIAILEKGAEIDNTRPDIHTMLGFCHFKL